MNTYFIRPIAISYDSYKSYIYKSVDRIRGYKYNEYSTLNIK